MGNWRGVFSYKTEPTFEVGSYDTIDYSWSSSHSMAYLETSYDNIVSKLGGGYEGDFGEDPMVYWIVKWLDGIIIEISETTRHWELEDEDDHYQALRDRGDDWSVFISEEFESKRPEVLKRLLTIFGEGVVKDWSVT